MALTSGTRLGSYEISEQIGKGGMGEVYRARDTKLGREVAIKVLPSEFSQDAERLARLEREARMLAALNHPNIAVIHGLEESDDTRFLVLELVEGDTLADRLKRGAVPVEESLKLALQIAEALEAAHEKGVIHRDLKPANIKITPDGRVKVLDFGLAKAFEGEIGDVNLSNSPTLSMQATQQGVILGTAAYMSPEQAKGRAVDKRTDVWSLGAVVYEMLTGRQAFEGDEVSEILASVLARKPDYTLLQGNLSPRIQRFLHRCLEKEPKKRWQDAGDVRIEITELLEDPGGVLVEPVAEVVNGAPSSKLVWVAAVVLSALITGVAVWWATPSEPRPVSRFSQPWPVTQAPRSVGRPVIALSRDGTRFIYNTQEGLYLRSLDELEPRLIPGTEELLTNPFFSPDGQHVAYWSPVTQQLMRVSISGGAPIPIAEATNPFGASWGFDDTIVFVQPEGIMRVSSNGGDPVLVVATEPGGFFYGPEILPGGEWVLFSSTTAVGPTRWDEAQIVVASLETGDRRILVEGGTDARYVPTGHLVYAFESSLLARPFDPRSAELTGDEVSIVAEGLVRANQTTSGAANYGFADNGTLVQLFSEDANAGGPSETSLFYADLSGALERIDIRPASYGHARVSPDGTRLAVHTTEADGDTEVWIYDLDGQSQIRQLTQGGNNSRPIWSSDSTHVTFTSTRDGTPSIWQRVADGSSPAEQLTFSEGPEHWPDAWSPDGETLLFTSYGGPEAQSVFTLTLGDENGAQEFAPGLSGGAAFSPDGGWIAYRSANPETPFDTQLFLKSFPVTGPEYQVSQNGGSHPIFSPDGRFLIYRRAAVGAGGPPQNELVAIDITTEDSVTYGAERIVPVPGVPAVFGVRDFEFMPDGEQLLVMRTDTGTEAATTDLGVDFHIVLNWFEYLKERVPVP